MEEDIRKIGAHSNNGVCVDMSFIFRLSWCMSDPTPLFPKPVNAISQSSFQPGWNGERAQCAERQNYPKLNS